MTTSLLGHAEYAPLFYSCEVVQGRDKGLMQKAFELRYQVYCLERGFLPVADYPNRCETDAYDTISAHFCVFNLRHQMVGYVRLVPPDQTKSFPFQSHCSTLLKGAVLAPPSQAAEISRLMVRYDYRRRRGDVLEGVTVNEEHARDAQELRDHSPQILLSLYRQMYAFSRANGIRYWYAAMERPLARALTHMHFPFRHIGPTIDYYGLVAPYLGDLRELEDHLGKRDTALLAWMQRPVATAT
jgi:N-acyl amino acid synthase of PEP-CTERM/exosortase system